MRRGDLVVFVTAVRQDCGQETYKETGVEGTIECDSPIGSIATRSSLMWGWWPNQSLPSS